MKAFLDDPKLAIKIRAQAQAHFDADEIVSRRLAEGTLTVDAESGKVFSTLFANAPTELGSVNTKGYLVCTLHWRGVRKQAKLHRIVWISVNGSIPDGLMPDHDNRIKNDNRIANLKLVDAIGNSRNRRTYTGAANPAAKLDALAVEAIRNEHAGGVTYSVIAEMFGVSESLIAKICRRQLWN